MEKITFTLPKTLKAAIDAAAAAEGRDPSSYLRYSMALNLGIPLPPKPRRAGKKVEASV